MTEDTTVATGEVDAPVTEKETPVESKDDAGVSVDETVNLQVVPEPTDEDAEPAEPSEDDTPAEDGEPEDGEEEGEEEEVEMIKFNFGGNDLEVPKDSVPQELVDKIQNFSNGTFSDYTKGKQDNAATAASLKERGEALDKMTTMNGDILDAYSQGRHLQDEIAKHAAVKLPSQAEMDALWQSNPDQARRLSDQIGTHRQQLIDMQSDLSSITNQVGQKESELNTAQQAELERRTVEGTETLDRRIKNFSKEHAPAVVQYAIERGIPEVDAQQWSLNPVVTEMAHKAMMYDRMQAKTKSPAKPRLAVVKPVKAPKGPGKATAGKSNPATESDAAFAKRIGMSG